MKAALYIRVSTEEQAQHGLSVEAQTAALREWAKKEKVKVVGEYIDAGFSARKPASTRPELQRMLNDVRAGKVELIVFTKLDRWFRNIAEYYKVQEVLESNNTSWKAIHEDYETVTSSGRLKVNIMLAVSQDEADRTSERINRTNDRKKELREVMSGKVSVGYKIENKKYVIDEEKVDMVRDMFAYYMESRSAYATQRYMLARYGFKRDVTTLKRMLRNPIYKGELHGDSEYAPAIIEPARFDEIQEMMNQRAARHGGAPKGNIYLFKGLLKCGECGHSMTGLMGKGNHYYRCADHIVTGLCKRNKHVRESVLEQYLVEHLLTECAAYNIEVERASKSQPQKDEAAIRRKMIKLKDLYLNDLIEKADYEKDYTILKEELGEIQKQKDTILKPIDTDALGDVIKIYESMERAEKRAFWNMVIKEIQSYSDGSFSFTLRHI